MSEQSGGSVLAATPSAGYVRRQGQASDPERLQPLRRIDLLVHLSGAFDLAESRELGHAARVAHIAQAIGQRIGFDAHARSRLLYVALLHDAGVAVRQLSEDVDNVGGHTAGGVWAAGLLGLNGRVQDAIRASHERWDGEGRPHGLAMAAIPNEALLASAAHWVSDQIAPEDNPLRARAKVLGGSPANLGSLVGSRIADTLHQELRGDGVWMPLWDDRLPAQLAEASSGEGKPSLHNIDLVATAMGDIIDSSTREAGRSRRVAALAVELARLLEFDEPDQVAVAVAGHLLDLGHLGVPRHITEKPDILSVDEMEIMRRHPGWGAQLLERIPGFEQIARWVQHHHERPDGRGYPSLLDRNEIPLASLILGVADAYWALCSDRSDRPSLASEDVLRVMADASGEQFEGAIVEELPAALAALATPEAV